MCVPFWLLRDATAVHPAWVLVLSIDVERWSPGRFRYLVIALSHVIFLSVDDDVANVAAFVYSRGLMHEFVGNSGRGHPHMCHFKRHWQGTPTGFDHRERACCPISSRRRCSGWNQVEFWDHPWTPPVCNWGVQKLVVETYEEWVWKVGRCIQIPAPATRQAFWISQSGTWCFNGFGF